MCDATYSNEQGGCIEVSDLADVGRAARDSKEPAGPVLVFNAAEWVAFTAGVRAGVFG